MEINLDRADGRAPNDIDQRIAAILRERPELRWDAAVNEVLTGTLMAGVTNLELAP